MNYRIKFSDGTVFQQPETTHAVVSPLKAGREWRRITVIGTVEAVKAAFVDGAQYVQAWDSTVTQTDAETGEPVEVVVEESRDLSDWSVAGEVVDHRDGTVCVLMGKPTEIESMAAREAEYIENLRALGVEV